VSHLLTGHDAWREGGQLLGRVLGFVLEGGLRQKPRGLLLGREQKLYVAPQRRIIRTGFREKRGALLFVTLKRCLKKLVNASPPIVIHRLTAGNHLHQGRGPILLKHVYYVGWSARLDPVIQL
jgi:hypothetical protein